MKTVGAYEAKTHLSELLDEVSRGERVSITRKGEPVAMMVPVPAGGKADPKRAIEELREFRRGIRLGAKTVRALVEEGRRF